MFVTERSEVSLVDRSYVLIERSNEVKIVRAWVSSQSERPLLKWFPQIGVPLGSSIPMLGLEKDPRDWWDSLVAAVASQVGLCWAAKVKKFLDASEIMRDPQSKKDHAGFLWDSLNLGFQLGSKPKNANISKSF